MPARIAYITLLVRDQDEALRFYTEKLGWEKREEDTLQDLYGNRLDLFEPRQP